MPEDFTSASDKECRIGGYVVLRTIGKGSFAKVMLARHIATGTEVAVKIISRRGSSLAFREIHCLKNLNHPNITKLSEVMATENELCLVMEHMSGGELSNYIEKHGARTEEEARTIFRQLVSALHHCHQKGFVHRDLKPENILLDSDKNVKLADFGFTKEEKHNLLSSFCGTATFPFKGENFGEVKRRVLRGYFLLPHFLSEECQHLLQNILTLDPAQRPTLDAIMKDPWVNRGQKEGVNLYSEPLCGDIDPQISEQMKHLGYTQEELRESVAHKAFDNIMGTYLILRSTNMNNRGHTLAVTSASSQAQVATTTSSEPMELALTSATTEPEVVITTSSLAWRVDVSNASGQVDTWSLGVILDQIVTGRLPFMAQELQPAGEKTSKSTNLPINVAVRVAVPTTGVAASGTLSTTCVAKKVAIPATSLEVNLAVPSASTEVSLAIPTPSLEVILAVPSASTEAEEAIPSTGVERRVGVSTTSGEVKVVIKPESVKSTTTCPLPKGGQKEAVNLYSAPLSQGEVATKTSFVPMELADPSASSQAQVATTTSSEPMELALTSATTEPEVVITTSSLAWRVDVSNASGQVSTAESLFRLPHYTQGFKHRDLKPENILLDTDNNVKLADFSLSKEFWKCKLTSFCGTMWYVAPEILSSEPYDGQRVDIWSLGVVLYQLVTGRLPFEGENFWEVKRRVLRGYFLLPHFLSEDAKIFYRTS
ncbi:serine/threonine-protein kinase MARK1-like [Phyllostomus hastatus]|uniref:serine/threonine-protein kinase MARK1-like n=1 Tax=Phyllostomus hastatus TaxID=9423 RepID=UPI001E67E8EF|nr:serine/threonine-protein kinase MARK1-like [Phyllostomus hastatus]